MLVKMVWYSGGDSGIVKVVRCYVLVWDLRRNMQWGENMAATTPSYLIGTFHGVKLNGSKVVIWN